MKVGVKVEGIEETLRTLQRLHPSLAENGLRAGVGAVGREIVKEARRNLAPHKRTGNLARSLGVSTRINRIERSVTGKARTRSGKYDGFYGRFLEFGTKYIAPIAFLSRAGSAVTPRAPGIIAARIRKQMPKIIARAKAKGLI